MFLSSFFSKFLSFPGAIRQLSKSDERVNKFCKYLLTLVCGGSTEFTKSQDFIESTRSSFN